MPSNFVETLSRLQKEAQLQGRPLSSQVTAGVATAESETASVRLARIKGLELAKQKHEETTAIQKEQFDAKMAADAKDRRAAAAASKKSSQASGAIGGAMAGFMYGAEAGTAVSPGWGTVIGGVVGAIAGSCIIISACTSRDSYEVEIAREFRDKYMSDLHLGGYYALALKFVPLMEKSHFLKLITKKVLVDRLVDYGEFILGYKPKTQLRTSRIITEGFLKLCAVVGMHVDVFYHIEAHR